MSYFVFCPHCDGGIKIKTKDINCGIYRHGQRKDNLQQLPPHASQQECEYLLAPISGCGKPFQVIKDKDTNKISTIQITYNS